MMKKIFVSVLIMVLLLANYYINWSDDSIEVDKSSKKTQLAFNKDDFKIQRYDVSVNYNQLYKRRNIFNLANAIDPRLIKPKKISSQPKVVKKDEVSEHEKKKKSFISMLNNVELLGVIKKSKQLNALIRYKDETEIVKKNSTYRDVFVIAQIGVDTIELTNDNYQITKVITMRSE